VLTPHERVGGAGREQPASHLLPPPFSLLPELHDVNTSYDQDSNITDNIFKAGVSGDRNFDAPARSTA